MKILLYRNDWNANVNRRMADEYGGSAYYRIVKPAEHIKGHEVTVVGQALGRKGDTPEKKWSRIFKENDVFWTTYFYNAEEASMMFYHRDKFKKKVIIDLDDDYLAILPTHPLYDVMKPQKKNRAITSTILSFADAITVSTEPLKQKIKEHMRTVHGLDKPIFVLPNMNDRKDWDFKPVAKSTDKIIIGYSGSNSHYDDLAMFLPHLAEIMHKYPNVYFESIGAIGAENIKLFSCFSDEAKLRCDLLPSTSSFLEYPEHLSKQKWDIAVAPLDDSAFTRSKSHIKWLEYSMYKIPTIASRVYPYFMQSFGIDTIRHDESGLLVKPSEWFGAMEDLILNKERRTKLGEKAQKQVFSTWQYGESFTQRLDEILKSLI